MFESFKVLGLSFKKSPLSIREKLALGETESKRLLRYISDVTGATDVMILSTCNRTEIYYSSQNDLSKAIITGLLLIKGINDTIKDDFFYTKKSEHAVTHLFRVSMGLDAQVLGDFQIANQVKRAYQWSADENMAGPMLHRLMHTIFFANKRVVQETAFRDGAASVSYATKELVEDVCKDIPNPKVLILGLGEIGKDVCLNLVDSKIKDVVITNRTHSKAVELAEQCGFATIPFDEVLEKLNEIDVVISSIAMDQPMITKEVVMSFDLLTFKFFVDLSVPRSIEMDVEEIPGVLLYNIDNIQAKTSKALEKRTAAIADVENIISEAISEFQNWSKEMIVSPTINKLKVALEEIRKEEISRYVKDLNSSEGKMADKVTKSMMQKIIKLPILELKAACQRGEAENLIDVLSNLFDLEKRSDNAIK